MLHVTPRKRWPYWMPQMCLHRRSAGFARILLPFALLLAPIGAQAKWDFIEGEVDDGYTCIIVDDAQGTMFMMRIAGSHYVDGSVAVFASDKKWSIKQGDDLGEVGFYTATENLIGTPVATDGGFFFHAPATAVESWVKSAYPDGFYLTRNGKEFARFRPDNMAAAFDELRACADKAFGRDPFAD